MLSRTGEGWIIIKWWWCVSSSKSSAQGKQHGAVTWLLEDGDSKTGRELTDTSAWCLQALCHQQERTQRPHKDLGRFIKERKCGFSCCSGGRTARELE